jgi:hypothetical protein
VIAPSRSGHDISATLLSALPAIGATYKSVLLQRTDEFIGELDGVLSARKLISFVPAQHQRALLPLAWHTSRTVKRHAARPRTRALSFLRPWLRCWRRCGLLAARRDDAVAGRSRSWLGRGTGASSVGKRSACASSRHQKDIATLLWCGMRSRTNYIAWTMYSIQSSWQP